MSKIVVIGAGVIGLTSAWKLKEAYPDSDITVVATHLPGDLDLFYTSPYAGANWQSFAAKDDKFHQDTDVVAYHEFNKLADDPRTGIWRKPNAQFYTQQGYDEVKGNSEEINPWFYKFANGRTVDKSELLPGTVFGGEYDGYVISVPVYLGFLVQRCLENGVVLKRVPRIQHIDKAAFLHSSGKRADIVVNCGGLKAASIEGVDDPKRNFPVRGQVVLVRNTLSKVMSVYGFPQANECLYAFPRKEGGAIIGGSFYPDKWDSEEDKDMTKRILERAAKYIPELIDPSKHGNPDHFDIVRVNVGLRPYRESGARIERDPRRKWLIHGYGAGGGGYQGSYGFAKQIVQLVGETSASAKL